MEPTKFITNSSFQRTKYHQIRLYSQQAELSIISPWWIFRDNLTIKCQKTFFLIFHTLTHRFTHSQRLAKLLFHGSERIFFIGSTKDRNGAICSRKIVLGLNKLHYCAVLRPKFLKHLLNRFECRLKDFDIFTFANSTFPWNNKFIQCLNFVFNFLFYFDQKYQELIIPWRF